MKTAHGNQKNSHSQVIPWITPTSLLNSCSHRKQHTRHKSEGGKHKADPDLEDKGEESKPKKKKEVRKATRLCPGFGTGADYWSYRLQWRTCVPDEMGKPLMRLTWSLPRKPMSSAHRKKIKEAREKKKSLLSDTNDLAIYYLQKKHALNFKIIDFECNAKSMVQINYKGYTNTTMNHKTQGLDRNVGVGEWKGTRLSQISSDMIGNNRKSLAFKKSDFPRVDNQQREGNIARWCLVEEDKKQLYTLVEESSSVDFNNILYSLHAYILQFIGCKELGRFMALITLASFQVPHGTTVDSSPFFEGLHSLKSDQFWQVTHARDENRNSHVVTKIADFINILHTHVEGKPPENFQKYLFYWMCCNVELVTVVYLIFAMDSDETRAAQGTIDVKGLKRLLSTIPRGQLTKAATPVTQDGLQTDSALNIPLLSTTLRIIDFSQSTNLLLS
eukprot:bmy_13424T0